MLKNDLIKQELSVEHLAVLDALPMPAALFSATADLLCANQLFQRSFRTDLSQLISNKLEIMLSVQPDQSEFSLRCLEMEHIEPFIYSESERHYWLTLKPHYLHDGQLKHVMLCCADITNLKQSEQKLMQHNQLLKQQVYIDHLTQVLNRRGFDLQIEEWQLKLARQDLFEMSLIMCDLDNFKQINDIYGHDFGDEILVKSAQILMRVIESMEDAYVFRIGGEEFVIALPDMQLKDACHIAQQCCHQVSAMSANYADKVLKLSISCGVAHQYQDGVLAETLAKADQALYQAKYSSKNCTCYSDGDGINLFECNGAF